jgi:hypothetical protein
MPAKKPATKAAKKEPVKKTTSKKPVAKKTTKAKAKPKKQTFKQISDECKASIRMGRPTSYRSEFPEMMYDFFNKPAFEDRHIYNNQGEKVMATVATPYLSLASFAVYIGVTTETIRKWATETLDNGQLRYPEFSSTYHHVKQIQASNLVQNGATGAYKENFAKFLAINNHGYKERIIQDISVTSVGVETIDSETSTKKAADIYQAVCNED